MNHSMIFKLTMKDWHLFKHYIGGYVLLGLLSAVVLILPYEFTFYTGVVMIITVLIGSSAHLAITSVITEKKENQMSFMMAMPIDALDYSVSKMIGNLAIYTICWAAVMALTIVLILLSHIPNGLIPMVLLSGMEILVATTIILSIGLLTGSEGITIFVMIVLNVTFNLFLFSVVKLPGIADHISGAVATFNDSVFIVMSIEVALILAIILFTLYVKSRKLCFL